MYRNENNQLDEIEVAQNHLENDNHMDLINIKPLNDDNERVKIMNSEKNINLHDSKEFESYVRELLNFQKKNK